MVAVGRIPGETPKDGRPRSLNAWIDPPTDRVLATGEVAKTFTQILHRAHGSLLIPEVGRKIVGWLGWAMFVSSATGLWLWWPRHGGVLKGLRWRRGASTLFNLHHTVGFWVCIPLAVLSLTGVYISFPQTSRALFGLPAQPARPSGAARFAPPLETPRLTWAQAATAASAEEPGATVVELNAPTVGKAPAWRVGFRAPGEDRPRIVQVLDATGQVERGGRDDAAAADRVTSDTISPLMRRVHDGAGMGLVWQLIIFVGGLAPALLSVTGVIMWLRRRTRRRAVGRAIAL